MWASAGVIPLLLLSLPPPLPPSPILPSCQAILFRLICEGRYEFDAPYWDNVSKEAKDFISKLLVVDPSKRSKADDVRTSSVLPSFVLQL